MTATITTDLAAALRRFLERDREAREALAKIEE